MKHSEQKILIISLSGIGDLILFTPALPLLRKRFPDGEIEFLVKKKEAEQVLKGNPYIDKIIAFDPQKASTRENLQFYSKMRKQKYDISLSTFPAMTFLNNLSTFAIGARDRWVYKTGHPLFSFDFLQNRRIPYQHGKHRIDYNLAMVQAIMENALDYKGDSPASAQPEDPLEQVYIYGYGYKRGNGYGDDQKSRSDRKNRSDQILRSLDIDPNELLIGIHAGSGDNQPFKRWGEEKFALLADRIQKEFPFRVVLLGGPEEEEMSRRIAGHMVTHPAIAAGRTGIEKTLALIGRCELLISNDSGVMNMAFALRRRILAIFGPTDDTCTRPMGKNDIFILKELPCKPACRERYLFRKECNFEYQCLKDLSVDEVWEVARGILESIEKRKYRFPDK